MRQRTPCLVGEKILDRGANTSGKLLRYLLNERWPRDAEFIGAEVGVFEGRTSGHLLNWFPGLTLIMVDSWEDASKGVHHIIEPDVHLSLARAQTEFAVDRRMLLVSRSLTAAKLIPDRSLDWVYIDAGHGYDDVYDDLRAWTPKVKPGGLVAGHDYLDPVQKKWIGRYKHGVKTAVDEFVAEFGYELRVRSRATYQFEVPLEKD